MKFCNAPNCNNPVFSGGFCRNHQYKKENFDRRSILQRGNDKHKEQQKSNKSLENKIKEIDSREEGLIFVPKGSSELWRWFEKQREFMTGVCMNCGGKTEKFNNEKFHYSIAHLMPKNHFPSISTNDNNWIELCYYGNSCHSRLDNHMIDLTELNCWNTVIDKFIAMYPSIDPKERKRIPTVLLQYINTEI